MLKKMLGLVLGLVVLAGSACVTPTHASSASSVIITYVQAGGVTGAKEELIVLYNNSSDAINVTDWCLSNKSAVAFACFDSSAVEGEVLSYTLPPRGYLSIASEAYVQAHSYGREYYSYIYSAASQSSGTIVGSADSISVIAANQDLIANKVWTSPIATGKALLRIRLSTAPDIYQATDEVVDWQVAGVIEPPISSLMTVHTAIDEVSGEGPLDPDDPEGSGSELSTTPLLLLSEIFPNPSGSDVGKEYIEIYNPSLTKVVSLADFSLQIGFDNRLKEYSFPPQSSIAPLSYAIFFNGDIPFGLVNTTGAVQLFYKDAAVGDLVKYVLPKNDEAWAAIDGIWQYTTIPTPGLANLPTPPTVLVPAVAKAPVAPKPCATNQYRNPETGRCKLMSTASSSVTACKAGQERNPETNRCRLVASAAKAPAPCKEGQERSLETNRCRAIVRMSNADYKVQAVQRDADNQPRWYYWAAMAGVVVLVFGYAIWEWREELRTLWMRLRNLVRK